MGIILSACGKIVQLRIFATEMQVSQINSYTTLHSINNSFAAKWSCGLAAASMQE